MNYANSADDRRGRKSRPIKNDALGDAFGGLLYDACVNILTVTKGAVYMCMSSSELDTLQKAFREAGGKWSTFVIWAKNTFTLGRSDYQRQYEPILYGWKDGADHYWCGARDQGDVWFFDKPSRNDLHPTMKPVALVERAIRNSSKSRGIVLDPFSIASQPNKLKGLWADWEQANLLDRIESFDGAFVPRFIRGSTTTLSNHAFGSAFDINADTNPLGQRPPLVGRRGCTRELVSLAHKWGFFWGGHFGRRPDGMHFEIAFLK